jgi:molecular chaperone GrpE
MTGRGKEPSDPTRDGGRHSRVRVSDKRRTSGPAEPRGHAASDVAAEAEPQSEATEVAEVEALRTQVTELTNDLMRARADFENYRKRMMRDQAEISDQATAAIVKKLLPIVDNFDRALAHGADESVALLRKELVGVLAAEGVEEIPAQGVAFDPHLHEAVESVEDEAVSEPTVKAVYRAGYRLGSKVLRHSMVGVGRPADQGSEEAEEVAPSSDVATGES